MFRHWQRYVFAWFFSLAIWAIGLMPGAMERLEAIEEEPMPEYTFEEDMAILVYAVHAYHEHHGVYPDDGFGLEQLAVTASETPKELVPWGRAVTGYLLDPWERPYLFLGKAPGGPREFGIYSLGKDGKSSSQGADADDLNTWSGSQDYYIRQSGQGFMEQVLFKWLLYGHLTFFFMAAVLTVINRHSNDKSEPVFEILDD